MTEKTKKRLKKILKIATITTAVGVAGFVAYKKCPQVKGLVDATIKKVSGKKEKYPEVKTIKTPRPAYVNKSGIAYKK